MINYTFSLLLYHKFLVIYFINKVIYLVNGKIKEVWYIPIFLKKCVGSSNFVYWTGRTLTRNQYLLRVCTYHVFVSH